MYYSRRWCEGFIDECFRWDIKKWIEKAANKGRVSQQISWWYLWKSWEVRLAIKPFRILRSLQWNHLYYSRGSENKWCWFIWNKWVCGQLYVNQGSDDGRTIILSGLKWSSLSKHWNIYVWSHSNKWKKKKKEIRRVSNSRCCHNYFNK